MTKETALRRMVYAGTGLIIAVAAFIPLVVIPRMAVHPEAIEEGAVRSHWIFFIIQLLAAALLFPFILRNRHGGWEDKAFLVSVGIMAIVLSLIWLEGGSYYYGFRRFYEVAALHFICAGANLIAGILLISVRIMLRRQSSLKKIHPSVLLSLMMG